MRGLALAAALIAGAMVAAAGPARAQMFVKCADPNLRFELGDGEAPSPWVNAPVVTDLARPQDLLAYRGRRVIVSGVVLKAADFRRLRLANVCFEDSDLSGSDWTGAETAGLLFIRTQLENADLTGVGLKNALLLGSDLDGVRAAGARLNRTVLRRGSFDGLDLRGADLRDFRLTCALMNGDWTCDWPERTVDVRGADLTRASLDVYLTAKWRFDGARLDETTVQLRQIEQVRTATAVGAVRLAPPASLKPAVTLSKAEWDELVGAWRAPPTGPSFDCAEASTPVERAICDAPYGRLHASDRLLAEVYREALAAGRTTAAEQKRWLSTRSGCFSRAAVDDCLNDLYDARIAALLKAMGPPAWLTPGTDAVYADFDLSVSPEFRAGPLYRRLAPLIVSSADSGLHLRAVGPGQVKAEGWALGGNGHECSLGAEPGQAFQFNPRTGWFGGPHEPYERDRRVWEDVFRLAGDQLDVAEWRGEDRFSDYVGCGARAGFERMRLIPGATAAASE